MNKFIIALFFLSSIGFAALPPLYQNTKEIKKILNDNRLYEKLGSDQIIENISKSNTGWIITTSKYNNKNIKLHKFFSLSIFEVFIVIYYIKSYKRNIIF